jgi:hypothetical protein
VCDEDCERTYLARCGFNAPGSAEPPEAAGEPPAALSEQDDDGGDGGIGGGGSGFHLVRGLPEAAEAAAAAGAKNVSDKQPESFLSSSRFSMQCAKCKGQKQGPRKCRVLYSHDAPDFRQPETQVMVPETGSLKRKAEQALEQAAAKEAAEKEALEQAAAQSPSLSSPPSAALYSTYPSRFATICVTC